METVPAKRSSIQEHSSRPVDPMEAVRFPDRRIRKLCCILELWWFSGHQSDAKSSFRGAAVQLFCSVYRYVIEAILVVYDI